MITNLLPIRATQYRTRSAAAGQTLTPIIRRSVQSLRSRSVRSQILKVVLRFRQVKAYRTLLFDRICYIKHDLPRITLLFPNANVIAAFNDLGRILRAVFFVGSVRVAQIS
jgi:hypothetical protein